MENLQETLRLHQLWLSNDSDGVRADLQGADLRGTDLRGANLRGADLRRTDLYGADLRGTCLYGADLRGAYLRGADLRRTDLRGAYLLGADLRGVNLRGADLLGADLRAYGDMKYLKTMQFDTWAIGYTHDTLQIGCQTHPIDKWKRWNTEAGHKWVDSMDETALEWAKSNLDLVLEIIKVNPAWNTKG